MSEWVWLYAAVIQEVVVIDREAPGQRCILQCLQNFIEQAQHLHCGLFISLLNPTRRHPAHARRSKNRTRLEPLCDSLHWNVTWARMPTHQATPSNSSSSSGSSIPVDWSVRYSCSAVNARIYAVFPRVGRRKRGKEERHRESLLSGTLNVMRRMVGRLEEEDSPSGTRVVLDLGCVVVQSFVLRGSRDTRRYYFRRGTDMTLY